MKLDRGITRSCSDGGGRTLSLVALKGGMGIVTGKEVYEKS